MTVVAIPLFEEVTALDAIGPYEVLRRLPGTSVRFLASEPGPVRAGDTSTLELVADSSFSDVPAPDVVVVPGGGGHRHLLGDEAFLGWLRQAHATSVLTTSVCSGAVLLAAAGLLGGLRAATHWRSRQELATYGVRVTEDRVCEELDHRLVTSAGVSAGIDMALRVAELLTDTPTAQALQLLIEYDPRPPFTTGTPSSAPAKVQRRAAEISGRRP